MIRKKRGFTLIEVTIVAVMAAAFVALVVPALVNTLVMVQREATMLNMFRAGDETMARITSALRPAVLPMVTDENVCNIGQTTVLDTRGFRFVINTRRGFSENGCLWRTRFTEGTDFIPFTVPVFFGSTQNPTDDEGLPFLGMRVYTSTGYQTIMATQYTEVTPGSNSFIPVTFAASGARTLHPALYSMRPADFGVATIPNPINPNAAIYSTELQMPDAAMSGYAVIRFVPYPDADTGAPTVLAEQDLEFDLNENGTMTDTFMLGSIEIVYHDPTKSTFNPHPRRILSPPMVLAQLNTDAPGYVPIFRLVSWGDPARSPGSVNWTPTQAIRNGYTVMVSLLMFDQLNQRSPLSFANGKPLLTRRFETMVELRNMSRQ